jgi:hypothetical protein
MQKHKDLPGGSQAWADEVDALMAEVTALKAVVRRLSENAGLDFSNPGRGVNVGDTPSITNPVGQKLSSLADVQTYNVADGQYLGWSQKGQKWLPVTLPSTIGTIDISTLSYTQLKAGYGTIDSPTKYAYTAAGDGYSARSYAEIWSTDTTYVGAGNFNTGPVALIELWQDGFHRPGIIQSAQDYVAGSAGYATLGSYFYRLDGVYFVAGRFTTAARPTGLDNTNESLGAMVYDTDLRIPIWWSGTTWTNALGTAV